MDELLIIPEASNTFRIKIGDIELYVYCSDNQYISIRSKGRIEYPEVLMGTAVAKDGVRFFPPEKELEGGGQ